MAPRLTKTSSKRPTTGAPSRPATVASIRILPAAAPAPKKTTAADARSGTAGPTGKSSAPPIPDVPDISDYDIDNIPIHVLTLDVPLLRFNPMKNAPPKPKPVFHFLAFPPEIRIQIYTHYFREFDRVLDLSPENARSLNRHLSITRVCRQLHSEVTHFFYSTRPLRLFPIHPGRHFKSKRPLLARLKPHQRTCLQTLDLRIGPGWHSPPPGWVVNPALGLADCVSAKVLRVLVECDTSDGHFQGYRRENGFYEGFCQALLADVITGLPNLQTVEFDGWSSVRKAGLMMSGLIEVATQAGLRIGWGPERGWTDRPEEEAPPLLVNNAPITQSTGGGVHNGEPSDVMAAA